MVTARKGRPRVNEPDDDEEEVDMTPKVTTAQAARLCMVNPREVERMRALLLVGTPELLAAVRDDVMSLSDASYVAYMEPRKQLEMIQAVKGGNVAQVRKEIIAARRKK